MDTKLPNGTRYRYHYLWEHRKNSPYNYDVEGLMPKIISHKIVESNNEVLKMMLNYYERSLVMVMKYIDHLKHFKNPHCRNR